MRVPAAGSDDRKKLLAVAGFAVVAGLVLYFELRDTSVPAPAPGAVASALRARNSGADEGNAPSGEVAAKAVGTASVGLDPTLHREAMLVTESVAYEGGGRNIFSAASAPLVAIPQPVAKPRPVVVAQVQPKIEACPPNCPLPPPIDLKFFGTSTTTAHGRQAFLLHGDEVFLASPGDIVLRRYRVVTISATTILVEDMPNNNRQSLPLQGN